jgi:hypothetical protein
MKVLFFLLLISSCTRYAEVTRDSVNTRIQGMELNLSALKEGVWKVGEHRSIKVSDSFSFMLELPKLRDDDMEYLSQKVGINGWIIRVIFRKGSGEQDLGSSYTLFKKPQSGRTARGGGPAGMVHIKIFYAAKFASERFRTFKCPAFGHNKRITQIEIRGEPTPIDLSATQVSAYEEKSQLIGLHPSSFNAGHSLVGDYYVEIAPYDPGRKQIYSEFKRLPQYISVKSEELIQVKGCEGVQSELQPI